MIVSYLRIALRNFSRQRSYTALNVIGLCVGMTSSILIFQYVKYEKSFDSFHPRIDDLYRVQYNGWQNGLKNFESALAVPVVGPALKNNFPEVEDFVRMFPVNGVMAYESPENGIVSFTETKQYLADPSVFNVFNFGLLNGDPQTCLSGANKVTISQRAARKFFGNNNPLGKMLMLGGTQAFEVTGVFRDVPENSHIKFDYLFSYETLLSSDRLSEISWGWYDFYVYVLLKPGTDVPALQKKWDNYVAQVRSEEWKKRNSFQEFILRPVSDIHLSSNLLYEARPNEQRDGNSVDALTLIAILILAIGWVNYINLATARAMNRANEVGVRKVVGAHRSQLIWQFLIESALLNVAALVISLLLLLLLWRWFFDITGWNVPLTLILQDNFILMIGMIFAGGIFLSGFYPSWVLSSFKPVLVLKGKIVRSATGNMLRRSLVVIQFSASIFLIAGSIIAHQQLWYMKDQRLGVKIDNTLVVSQPGYYDSLYGKHMDAFKNELRSIAGVTSVSSSHNMPGDEIIWSSHVRRMSGGPEGDVIVPALQIDDQYVPSFEVDILAGRNFSDTYPNEREVVLINEALLKMLEFKDPKMAVGQKLKIRQSETDYETFEVVGVLKDYHQLSLNARIEPVIFRYSDHTGYYAIKVEPGAEKSVIEGLSDMWQTTFPGAPLDYFFLDEFFDRQYEKDNRFGEIFNVFTILAIGLSSMGLFGLASFVTRQRTKEIGVRKVLGSTVIGIVALLSRSFLKPVLAANLVAWPIAWWAMDNWLQAFPYHINISPVALVIAGSIVAVVAFASVFTQTMRAATTSPVKSLKYE